jgi:23S rRNA (cytidine1920-2'-O)/16S rRNA (cytidine1409-2'-O)-methyltransferase
MPTRADIFLVEHGYASTRAEAQAAIRAGNVRADGRIVAKPSQNLADGMTIEYRREHPFVSRGGVKLDAAIMHFAPMLGGWFLRDAICLDIGASTGGFTHALTKHGAEKVYAVDVGHGQMHPTLAASKSVVLLEGRDARNLTDTDIPEKIDGIVADVSFISLKLVLAPTLRFVRTGGWLIALVKPQFEAGREAVGKGGIVRDAAVQDAVLNDLVAWLNAQPGWSVIGAMESPIMGGDGNREFLVAARKS